MVGQLVNIAKPGSKKIEKIPVFANNGNKIYTLLRRTWTELVDLVLGHCISPNTRLQSFQIKGGFLPNKSIFFFPNTGSPPSIRVTWIALLIGAKF